MCWKGNLGHGTYFSYFCLAGDFINTLLELKNSPFLLKTLPRRLYDVDKDGRLSKEDFKEVLSHLVGDCFDYNGEMEKVIMRAIDETG